MLKIFIVMVCTTREIEVISPRIRCSSRKYCRQRNPNKTLNYRRLSGRGRRQKRTRKIIEVWTKRTYTQIMRSMNGEKSWDLYETRVSASVDGGKTQTLKNWWTDLETLKHILTSKKKFRSGHAWRTDLDLTNNVLIVKQSGKRPSQRWTVQ